jgi:hypothetical protein
LRDPAQIAVAVEIVVAKVLHATQLKFHARRFLNTTSKALPHFATRIAWNLRFGTQLALPSANEQ